MELNLLLEQIDSLKKDSDSLRPYKPEWERVFWEKFRLEFNYNSNHMEGNTLTYGQTKLLLLFDRTSGDNKGREIEEMKAHDVALKMVTDISSDPETALTEKIIREINEIILVRPFYNNAITPDGQPTKRLITPGSYKKHPNSVLLPDGNMFNYASPEETPALMGDLIEWYNQNKKIIHPVRLAALIHYKLVRIHPFDDSNGRTTRLIMNFILMQNGYAPLVIESKNKEDYLTALNKADVGDIGAFEEYIAEVAFRWQEIFLKAIKGEKVEDPDDLEKEIQILKKTIDRRNEKNEIEFSLNRLNEILTTDIYYLTSNLIAKISSFDDLFENRQISFLQVVNTSDKYVLTDIFSPDKIKVYLEEITEKLWSKNLPIIIIFNYEHKKFKKADHKGFGYITTIQYTFNSTDFKININNNFEIEKKYNEQLSEQEINELIDYLIKQELKEVKTNI
ncbi:MAG TPA: Fic family protein [Chitinophagaceae bacterium]|nr:Fic family protein [Chitinophagaceae bacterium]